MNYIAAFGVYYHMGISDYLRAHLRGWVTPPPFGLFCSMALSLLILVMMVITGHEPAARGLRVYLPSNITEAKLSSPLQPHVVVHIRASQPATPARVYVNGTLVDWKDLPDRLNELLKQQQDWVVYLDADPEVDWQSVIDGVNAISEVMAKPVLLTSPSKHSNKAVHLY